MLIDNDAIDRMVFVIERWVGGDIRHIYPWTTVSPTASDLGEPANWPKDDAIEAPLAREFSACGVAWQRYRIFGTTDIDLAHRALAQMVKHHPDERYRLVHRHYRIDTTVVRIAGRK